jgi:DNA-binding NarL/FixJ family response regulator
VKPPKLLTVLVADDHPLALEGVHSLLSKASDIKIVGEVQDGNEIKGLVAKLRPQILLLDLRMPNLSPVELEKWVKENYPETITLVFTAHHHVAYLAGMMEAGAAGYLDKKLEGSDLIASIRRAARGEILFDKRQISRARHWHEDVEKKWNSLSERERQILRLLADGASNKDIASHLSISVKTIEKHLERIYQKLEVDSRAKAALWGLKHRGDFPY